MVKDMIKKILKGSSCAACRMCCIFDRYDVWETPLFEENTMNKVKSAVPNAEFAKKGGGYVLNVGKMTGDELFKIEGIYKPCGEFSKNVVLYLQILCCLEIL